MSGGFRSAARIALEDVRLISAVDRATTRFREARGAAMAELPESEALRDHFKRVRSATLKDLDTHLRVFKANARAAGAEVHFAADGKEACEIITRIAGRHGATLAAKSKSMTSEEVHLNTALEADGIRAVETDLGEWIVQLAGEPPAHIIAPAIQKTKEEIADIFAGESGGEVDAQIPALTAHARKRLRAQFLAAGIGISGGNIAVAETGSLVLVTNEGNGRMVSTLPPVHIALVGIEKIAPDWDTAAAWLALLARSATGQPLSIYTNIITGPARPEDIDGPGEVHIVFLDNGRRKLLGTQYEEVLQCIRCGACLNVCPVYRATGGHAYKGETTPPSPYSGPIGAVVTPLLMGLKEHRQLPQASSLCGACLDVCPVRIDLPRMLVELRRNTVEAGWDGFTASAVARLAASAFGDEDRLDRAAALARFGDRIGGRIIGGDLPKPAPQSFRDWWRAEREAPAGTPTIEADDGGKTREENPAAAGPIRPASDPANRDANTRGEWAGPAGQEKESPGPEIQDEKIQPGESARPAPAEGQTGAEHSTDATGMPDPWRSRRSFDDPAARFAASLKAVYGEVIRAQSPTEALEDARELLHELGARSVVSSDGLPAAIMPGPADPWQLARVGDYADNPALWREICARADAGVTGADALLAETGSVVLRSGRGLSRMVSLLPPVHIVLAPERLLTTDLFTWLAGHSKDWPANTVLVSGPSKTGDIEQTLSVGVHGPKRFVVVLYKEDQDTDPTD